MFLASAPTTEQFNVGKFHQTGSMQALNAPPAPSFLTNYKMSTYFARAQHTSTLHHHCSHFSGTVHCTAQHCTTLMCPVNNVDFKLCYVQFSIQSGRVKLTIITEKIQLKRLMPGNRGMVQQFDMFL